MKNEKAIVGSVRILARKTLYKPEYKPNSVTFMPPNNEVLNKKIKH